MADGAVRTVARVRQYLRRRYSDHPPAPALESGRPGSIGLEQEVMWLRELLRSYNLHAYNRLSPLAENYTDETAEVRDGYLKNMFREPFVKSAFWSKVWAVAEKDLQVAPADKTSALDKKAAEFVKHAINRSEGGRLNVVQSIACGALIQGWSLSEKVFRVEDRPPWQNLWTLRVLKPKDTRFVNIEVDEYKNVIGLWATAHNANRRFDPNDFVLFTYQSLFASPLGISDFRAVNRAVTLKEAAVRLRMVFLDKFSGPYLKGRYGDDSQKRYLHEVLKKARGEGTIVLPPGTDVEVINLATSSPEQFKSAIDDFDREILVGLRGAHLDMLEGQTAGNRGDTRVQKSMAELAEWWLSEAIATKINESLVPDLVVPNFGPLCGLPTVSFGAINPADILRELEIDEKLSQMGVPLSLEDIYERARRNPPKRPEDTLRRAVPAAAPGAATVPGAGQRPPNHPIAGDRHPIAGDRNRMVPGRPAPAGAPAGEPVGPREGGQDLLSTVGGLQAVQEMQASFYRGEIPHEAAVNAMVILFGLERSEAEALFPEVAPVKRADDDADPPGGAGTPPFTRSFAGDAAPLAGAAVPSGRVREVVDRAVAGGSAVLAEITRPAVARLLAGRWPAHGGLFDDAELERLADALAAAVAAAELLGRWSVRGRLAALNPEVRRFADLPVLKPLEALSYFQSLVPSLGLSPSRFGPEVRRQAFTLAVNTSLQVLAQVQRAVLDRLRDGRTSGPRDVEDVLERAGVSPSNPQYAEMVFRTNAMDAYNTGQQAELREPEVREAFPVWEYLAVVDERSRPHHAARHGRYYPSSVPFARVRGTAASEVVNCRCTFAPVYREDWERLRAQGAELETTW